MRQFWVAVATAFCTATRRRRRTFRVRAGVARVGTNGRPTFTVVVLTPDDSLTLGLVVAMPLAHLITARGRRRRRRRRVTRVAPTKVGPRVRGVVRPIHRDGAAVARETLVRALRWPVIIAEALRDTNAALGILDV